MIELRDCTGLAIEALPELRISGGRRRQDLDRNGAIEAGVSGLVDFSHPAGTDQRHDFVRTEPGARSQGHAIVRSAGLCRGDLNQNKMAWTVSVAENMQTGSWPQLGTIVSV